MSKIIVEQTPSGYKAYLSNDRKTWEHASSVDGAIAAMHLSVAESVNYSVSVEG